MSVPSLQTNFNGGELSPDLWGHVDLAMFHRGAATARNMIVNYKGGLYSRPGTAVVGRTKQTPPAAPPRDIPFQFSNSQGRVLEFGDNYMRVKIAGAYALESAFNISAATQANPCQITASGQNFAVGDWVYVAGVGGMTALNAQVYLVGASNTGAGTFTLTDLDGNAINSTGFGAYTSGGTVARIYTLVTPYAAVDLPYLKYAQSADVLSLACVNLLTGTEYQQYDLSRLSDTNWTITALSLSATISPPSTVTATASNNPNPALSPPTQPCAYAYVVTAVNQTTGAESVASNIANVTNSVDMGVTAGSITVSWSSVTAASLYNIYRTAPAYNTQPGNTGNALPPAAGAAFYYAGQAFGNVFVDTNVQTDATQTPPLFLNPFARGQILYVTVSASSTDWTTATTCSISTSTGSGFVGQVVVVSGSIYGVIVLNSGKGYAPGDTISFSGAGTSVTAALHLGPQSGTYAAVVAYFQQRRLYAQSLNNPDTFWASQEGLYTNFDSGTPPIATDSITASPFSAAVNGIQWLVPMPGGLVVFSGTSAWQLAGTGGSAINPQPITPTSLQAQPQAFNGVSATLPPLRLGYDILFGDAVSSAIYSFNYNIYFNIYNAEEISWASSHLFDGHSLLQWTWCRNPDRVIWGVRDDGVMTSLTWVKEQQVSGWTRHDTQGVVVGVTSVIEAPVDALYLIVNRYVQGRWLYFSERMDNHHWPSLENCWLVDCGLSTLTASAYPAATLTAALGAGQAVTFTASASVFTSGSVGSIVRMGGGIATITKYTSGTVVAGVWTRPLTAFIPGDVFGTPLPAPAGTWTLLPQTTAVSGLGHLNGKPVVGLADGVPIGPIMVSGGSVTLPFAASLVTLGLSYTQQFQSLYLAASDGGDQGRRKTITAVNVRLKSSGLPTGGTNEADGSVQDPPQVAPTWTALVPMRVTPPQTLSTNYQTAAGQTVMPLFTGDVRANVRSAWRKRGQVALQQSLPLPMNITALMPEYLPGDAPEMRAEARERPGQGAPRAPA